MTEQSREVANRYMAAMRTGDVAEMDRVQHRDATWWVLGGGTMTREHFMGLVASMFETVTERTVTILGMTVEGDRVAIEMQAEMHFPDKIYRNSYHNLLVIRDGLIAEGREYLDTLVVARTFGTGQN
ncbi:MAG: nuclear transport factor 2 family protein [Janthinobacterium lividum]